MELTAGVARANITPPIGLLSEGYILRIEPMVGVDQQLFVTALVLADERAKVAILDCDVLGMTVAAADELRARVGEAIGTPASHVLLAWTHTHNGPKLALTSYADGGALSRDAESHAAYVTTFCNQVVGAAKLADGTRRPARAAAGSGSAPVAINRLETLPDGSVILGQNPDGPTDHEVGVVRIDGLDGAPIAAIVNYAAHPVVLGPEPLLFDADYPGITRQVVERNTGATCLFLMGAAGDQMPIEAWTTDPRATRKIGGFLGHEAAKVFHGIETRRTEVVKRHVKSLAEVLAYDVVEVPGPTHRYLGAADRHVALPRLPLPSVDVAERIYQEKSAELAAAKREGASERLLHIATIEAGWAANVLDRVRAGARLDPIEGVVQAIRLDDIAILTAPGEAFVRIGLEAKARSPLRHTLFASYCNGGVGYIPTPDAYPKPGQRVLTPDNVYYKGGLLSPLGPECAGTVVKTGLELLDGLVAAESLPLRAGEGG